MKKILVIGCVMLFAAPTSGNQSLTLNVTPAKSFAPAVVRIRARVEPNADNRRLSVVADGPSMYRSSEIPLDGADAPRMVELSFAGLPGGDYEISVVLTDASGHSRATAREAVEVLGEN
jgi:hypothetical protein